MDARAVEKALRQHPQLPACLKAFTPELAVTEQEALRSVPGVFLWMMELFPLKTDGKTRLHKMFRKRSEILLFGEPTVFGPISSPLS